MRLTRSRVTVLVFPLLLVFAIALVLRSRLRSLGIPFALSVKRKMFFSDAGTPIARTPPLPALWSLGCCSQLSTVPSSDLSISIGGV